MPVVMFMPVGRFRVTAEDSARRSPPKHLYLDDSAVLDINLYQQSEYGTVFAGNIDVAKSRASFTTLTAESTYADTADGLLVVMTAADSVAPGADLRLVAVVTEDSVITSGFLQARWDNMARRVIPDYAGRSITLARGDTLYDTFRFSTTGCNPAQLGAAVYLQDARDGSILQSLNVRRFNQ
jgi:hypothetical protein